MTIINILLIIVLIGLTSFFVASEFAIVKVRPSRIDQLVSEGKKGAEAAKHVTSNLDEYLSAAQLGITLTSLGLGWLGEPTIQDLLEPFLEKLHIPFTWVPFLSFFIAFSFITFLHVVIGELAPKTFAIYKAEKITLLFAKPLIYFYKIMFPFIWLLNKSAQLITKLFGISLSPEHEISHSEEEIRILLSESLKSGEINTSEFNYVNRIFEFDNRIAKEIMIPRTEIISFHKNASLKEILKTVQEEGYTRYPVTDGDKDNIIGFINIKEVLTDCIYNNCPEENPLPNYIKPIIRVIESIPIQNLLVKMQKERTPIAVLQDEYGGTAGMVTVEDILEEIVGEIHDEFDEDEIPVVRKINENHYLLDAKLLIEEVNDLLGTEITSNDVDTIGGWILTKKYNVTVGNEIEEGGFIFRVKEMDGHHLRYIEVIKNNSQLEHEDQEI